MSVFRTASVGAACLLHAALVGAVPQPAPKSAPTVVAAPATLRTAVHRVWENTPEISAARADLEAARARARAAAQPIYNPALNLDAENADVNRRAVGLSLPLDLSGKRRARAGQGDALLRAAEADYELRRRGIAVRWLKAWASAALAAKQSELGGRRLRLMQRFDELAAQRLQIGDISSPERDLAGLALGEAQAQQAALIGEEAAGRGALWAISGDQRGALPALPSDLPPTSASVTPLPVAALAELARARAQQDSAEAGVQVARRARISDPVLGLTGGQVRSGSRSDQIIGLSVSIPLPVLNTGSAEIIAARAEADAAAANVRAQQFAFSAGLVEAQTRYAALHDAATAFRSGRSGAFEDRAALLEKLWDAGEISTSDYLVQLKQSLDTALSGVRLESQAWQAWFDYLAVAGRLSDWLDGRTQEALR